MSKRQRAPKLVGDERVAVRDRLVERYQDGESIRALAADIDRSYGAVHTLLAEAGALRPVGRPRGIEDKHRPEGFDFFGRPDPDHDVDAELARYDFTGTESA